MISAIKLYRLARWLYLHHIPLLPKFIQFVILLVYACHIPYKAKIGKGTRLAHGGLGVTILHRCEIDENCVIGYKCSIVGQTPYTNNAKIGNNVWIAPGAVIQGPVIIEDNVIIGANAVVNKSVRAYSIVGGILAKVIGDVRKLGYDYFHNQSTDLSYRPFIGPEE
jgi:serine O-acetyltransferase